MRINKQYLSRMQDGVLWWVCCGDLHNRGRFSIEAKCVAFILVIAEKEMFLPLSVFCCHRSHLILAAHGGT
jgi:hypothetical protein